ncbi:hypothetical protein RUM43_012765 [Polyplax serrata]|uniref:NADH dehydrogenase [ubiquinone] 1 beta subcomplex subunit 3 n=1 Tax=Polyplax serrata TaxID=468196 RepID=A0AAN8P178_POLSC
MGGHNHVELPKIPDWRIYQVEDVPQLVHLRKALECRNLKDPWLRNHVWKYTEKYNNKKCPSVLGVFKIGIKYGFLAGLATTALEKAFFAMKGHGHEEHH